MIARRSLVLGAAFVATAAAGAAAKPSRSVSLLGGAKLSEVTPRSFGAWRSRDVVDPLALNVEGTLAGRLYDQQITRIYSSAVTQNEILLLIAYGARQTNELQLHRPEVCYPAFGYAITRNQPTEVALGERDSVPARQLLAVSEQRQESILYWSRLGEFLPLGGGEQRLDRVKIAVQGIVPDGLLARFSATTTGDPQSSWSLIGAFARDLILATASQHRPALIGSERAHRLAQAPPAAVL